ALLEQLEYWRALEAAPIPPIEVDYPEGSNAQGDAAELRLRLSKELSEELATRANRAFGTTAEDLLLTALGRALARWKGRARWLIEREGHGREDVLEGVDVSRTVGWFTSLYPFVLELSAERDLAYQIKSVKDASRRVPNRGVGYGALRYLRGDVD